MLLFTLNILYLLKSKQPKYNYLYTVILACCGLKLCRQLLPLAKTLALSFQTAAFLLLVEVKHAMTH